MESAYSVTDHLLLYLFGAVLLGVIVIGGLALLFRNTSLIGSAFRAFFGAALISVFISGFAYIWMYNSQANDEWQRFASDHCKVTEKREGQSTSGIGLSLSGKVGAFFGSTSAQTGYKCDDGVTYWKNN